MRTIDDLGPLRGVRVLVRSDLNVPLDDGGRITDDGRIRASVPTITQLRDAGAKVVVVAHLGRPKGTPEAKYSLRPVADRLAELADAFVSDGFGVVHRKQASVYDIARRLPHAAGGLVLTEVDVLRRLTQDPERPYIV